MNWHVIELKFCLYIYTDTYKISSNFNSSKIIFEKHTYKLSDSKFLFKLVCLW